MPNKKEFGQCFGSFRQIKMLKSRYTFIIFLKKILDGSMKEKDKLKEETEFWLTYIKDWKTNHIAFDSIDSSFRKLNE